MKKIIPAILTADATDFKITLDRLEGITDWVQIDIADGKFVSNTSINLEDIEKEEKAKEFSLEIHLMAEQPEEYFAKCSDIGAKRVVFHVETCEHIDEALHHAGAYKFEKGLALKPETSIMEVIPYAENLDVILLLSVNPGFQGQEFIGKTLEKIRALRKACPSVSIEVDGGITLENSAAISEAGADYFVVGSALLKSDDIKKTFEELNSQII